MAAKKKVDISPEGPVDLLALTDAQAKQVLKAVMQSRQAEARAKELGERVEELLAMVAPPGANGFDFKRMTFQSVPPKAPQE